MYFDAFTLSALVDEFMDTLVGGRVQDAIDVSHNALGLEIYADRRRHYLYLSADPLAPRVHLVGDKLRRGTQRPAQIGLLLRRYVEGGSVAHVSQPQWERVLHIDIEGPEGDVTLIVEPMERRSNILLVQNGVILDCIRRVGKDDNRYRVSLPAHEYVPPPPQTGRLDPFEVTPDDLTGILQQSDDPKRKVHQALAGRLLGISPLLAKEIVHRAGHGLNAKATEADPARLHEALTAVLEPLRRRAWQAGIVSQDGLAQAFSVYPITHLDGWQTVDDGISAAISAYYGAPVGEEAYTAAKKPVFAALDEARARLSARLASLERSMTDDAERETLRQSGELILAYQYTLQPGQTELIAHYDPDAPALTIRLDPQQSPLENAQSYFNRYNKAKRALDDVPRLIDETRTELDTLEQLRTDLELASNWPEIDEVQQALQAGGYYRGKPVRRVGGGGQSAPLRLVLGDGYIVWVGRNSRQNDLVTFKKASADDLWLHVRGVPGAHVIVKDDGRRIPEAVIAAAADLAAYYSALRREGKAPVDVTRVRHVRRIKGAAPGMVTYRNEETRIATPRDAKAVEADFD